MSEDRVAAAFDGIDPEELPESVDSAAVERIRRVAYLLDEAVEVPGTEYRIGLDPMLSVIPGNVGDVVSAGISLYIVAESARLGVSFTTLLRLLGTVAIDTAGGMVPVLGPVFDAVFKGNKWNVQAVMDEIMPEEAADGDGDDESEAVTIEVN